jgi:hypothetical protein
MEALVKPASPFDSHELPPLPGLLLRAGIDATRVARAWSKHLIKLQRWHRRMVAAPLSAAQLLTRRCELQARLARALEAAAALLSAGGCSLAPTRLGDLQGLLQHGPGPDLDPEIAGGTPLLEAVAARAAQLFDAWLADNAAAAGQGQAAGNSGGADRTPPAAATPAPPLEAVVTARGAPSRGAQAQRRTLVAAAATDPLAAVDGDAVAAQAEPPGASVRSGGGADRSASKEDSGGGSGGEGRRRKRHRRMRAATTAALGPDEPATRTAVGDGSARSRGNRGLSGQEHSSGNPEPETANEGGTHTPRPHGSPDQVRAC